MKKTIRFLMIVLLSQLSLCRINAQTLVWVKDGHPEGLQVNSVAFSPDGAYILSGTNCHPAKIRLFNTGDGSLVWDYNVDASLECMMGVGMSANTQYIAAAEETGNLMLFDYTQNPPALVNTIDLGTSYAFSVDFAPNSGKVAVGASGGKLKTYHLPAGAPDLNIAAHSNSWVTTVRYSPDNTRIASGGSDNKVKIWDTTGVLLKTLLGHSGDITAVRFTPDNQRVVSASQDNTLKIWEVSTGTLLHTIDGTAGGMTSLDVSPDGQFVVSLTGDGFVKIWRLDDFSLASELALNAYGAGVTVSWSPVSQQIVCGTINSKVVLYDVSNLTTGVIAADEPVVHIYPNPFLETLRIDFPQGNIQSLMLFDVSGRLVYSSDNLSGQSSCEITLDPNAPDGNYVLQLVDTSHHRFSNIIAKQ